MVETYSLLAGTWLVGLEGISKLFSIVHTLISIVFILSTWCHLLGLFHYFSSLVSVDTIPTRNG